MSIRVIVWTAIAVAAGVVHAAGLWRSAHASKNHAWVAMWRLPVVAAVLVSAALEQTLFLVVVGWAAGLTAASVVYLVRERRWM